MEYWDIGVKMDNQIETIEILGFILRLYWDNGKENGNDYNGVVQGFGFGSRV